ncbi:glucosylceramidase [Dysgonomonas sp. HDW5B]|uniref:glycoside hydrolase family 30 protein n=1 Tax=Dysgonomonas sp. HDW5B TaxID=2714927 RepID=UPI00140D9B25|nr:glycoside hydrolase family 30 beta sandwich domain-containing protein [Dysgonomonas sp. HDW5B]QIK54970.1 glucosylceramidase [Dysgonomonas sp. HDW5B]
MKKTLLAISFALALLSCSKQSTYVEAYVTTADKSMTMVKDSILLQTNNDTIKHNLITLDPSVKYQEMDGFGAAITGSTCYNLLKMTPENRAKLLKETFDPVDGVGYSYIRISIACSDFSLEDYTYCDKPGIENFEMHELDKRDLFPILKEILAINPNIKIMASPWTPPKWMKVNNLKDRKPFDSWTSGQLNPDYYQDYATYFVKYIQAMEKEGFNIESITIQNEPLNRGNSASLYMTWQEQRDFIKSALGPAFEKNGIKTKIVVYDHNYDYDVNKPENADQGQYPLKIYEDAEAAKYIDGAAYHAYGGDKEELLKIHEGRPDKNLYFTEMSIGLWGNGYDFGGDLMWNMREVCIGTINNFNKAVIMWNFMLDDKHAPFRPGGCDICLGAIDINSSDYATMTYNSHYYTMAHLSKVIKPGARRIKAEGNTSAKIHYSAFENPDGSYSVVLLNEEDTAQRISIAEGKYIFTHEIPAKAVVSYIWKNPI